MILKFYVDLMKTLMTIEVIFFYLQLPNVSIHRLFYQNRFINECAIKKKAKIP